MLKSILKEFKKLKSIIIEIFIVVRKKWIESIAVLLLGILGTNYSIIYTRLYNYYHNINEREIISLTKRKLGQTVNDVKYYTDYNEGITYVLAFTPGYVGGELHYLTIYNNVVKELPFSHKDFDIHPVFKDKTLTYGISGESFGGSLRKGMYGFSDVNMDGHNEHYFMLTDGGSAVQYAYIHIYSSDGTALFRASLTDEFSTALDYVSYEGSMHDDIKFISWATNYFSEQGFSLEHNDFGFNRWTELNNEESKGYLRPILFYPDGVTDSEYIQYEDLYPCKYNNKDWGLILESAKNSHYYYVTAKETDSDERLLIYADTGTISYPIFGYAIVTDSTISYSLTEATGGDDPLYSLMKLDIEYDETIYKYGRSSNSMIRRTSDYAPALPDKNDNYKICIFKFNDDFYNDIFTKYKNSNKIVTKMIEYNNYLWGKNLNALGGFIDENIDKPISKDNQR